MAPQPSKLISYQKCLGINRRVRTEDLKQPASFPPDPSYEVRLATNIDIDNANMPSSRAGYTRVATGSYKWLWSTDAKDRCFCVINGYLCELRTNYSVKSVLVSGIGNSRVCFQEVNDLIFFSNSAVNGYIDGDSVSAIPSTSQMFRIPLPVGQAMEYYRGRLYVGSGRVLWFSDAFRYFRLDQRRNFKAFPDDIDLIAAAVDGLYVAAGNLTYFLSGDNPHKFELRPVAGYGAFRGTRQRVLQSKLSERNVQDDHLVSVWVGKEGLTVGHSGGILENMTIAKYELPGGSEAAILVNTNANNENYSQLLATIR